MSARTIVAATGVWSDDVAALLGAPSVPFRRRPARTGEQGRAHRRTALRDLR